MTLGLWIPAFAGMTETTNLNIKSQSVK